LEFITKCFLFLTGVNCEQLTQPASVTVQPGQRLTITCQVSYSVSSYFTAWIRQPAGKEMEWIGYAAGSNAYYKDSLKSKFSISTDSSSNTVTLNGQNLQPEDTAVYYCARYTQQHKPSVDLNKNPSVPLMISHQFTVKEGNFNCIYETKHPALEYEPEPRFFEEKKREEEGQDKCSRVRVVFIMLFTCVYAEFIFRSFNPYDIWLL
uniref:Ig-like domain-containing protein n=1 Tax=Lates calcarifer TaxID=8187 RepID=A0A4W6EM15_LATCA